MRIKKVLILPIFAAGRGSKLHHAPGNHFWLGDTPIFFARKEKESREKEKHSKSSSDKDRSKDKEDRSRDKKETSSEKEKSSHLHRSSSESMCFGFLDPSMYSSENSK